MDLAPPHRFNRLAPFEGRPVDVTTRQRSTEAPEGPKGNLQSAGGIVTTGLRSPSGPNRTDRRPVSFGTGTELGQIHRPYEEPEPSSRATLKRRRRWRSAPLNVAAMKDCV
jgi:hypothetical protein